MIQAVTVLASIGLVALATFLYGDWGPVAAWRTRRLIRRAEVMFVRITADTTKFTQALQEASRASMILQARYGYRVLEPPGIGEIMKGATS